MTTVSTPAADPPTTTPSPPDLALVAEAAGVRGGAPVALVWGGVAVTLVWIGVVGLACYLAVAAVIGAVLD